MGQKVVAIKEGFHGGSLKKVGQVFAIGDKEKLGKWMLPYRDGDELPKAAKPPQMGDTKPKAAQEAARGKSAQQHQGDGSKADTKPLDAQKVAAQKATTSTADEKELA